MIRSIIIICTIFFASCSTWKHGIQSARNQDEIVNMAILDFVNTSRLTNHDSVFSVSSTQITNEIIGISIIGSINKFYYLEDMPEGPNLPSRFVEIENKLFYWYDEEYTADVNLINKLSEYNHIDSISSFGLANFHIDDRKEGIDYYFCKSNLRKFKKIKTSRAMGYYDPPRLRCQSINK